MCPYVTSGDNSIVGNWLHRASLRLYYLKIYYADEKRNAEPNSRKPRLVSCKSFCRVRFAALRDSQRTFGVSYTQSIQNKGVHPRQTKCALERQPPSSLGLIKAQTPVKVMYSEPPLGKRHPRSALQDVGPNSRARVFDEDSMEYEVADLMRMIERQLIVLGGILAIFLGYRLFRIVDIPPDSEGKLKTKLIEVTATKIGPGVFFAAFGVFVLWTSMNQQIRTTVTEGNRTVTTIKSGLPLGQLSILRNTIEALPEGEQRTKAASAIDDIQKLLQQDLR